MVSLSFQTMSAEVRRQQQLTQSIADDQAMVSSGKKITVSSQDPQVWVQISELGRAQAQNSAWTDNISYGQARAGKAEDNLQQINTLFGRARELIVTASNSTLDVSGKAAITAELESIRASISDLLTQTDYNGVPIFDDTISTKIPVSQGLQLDVVGTRQSVSTGVDVNGTPRTLDDILAEAINATTTGLSTDLGNSLKSLDAGLNHVIQQQSVQGIRGDRLDAVQEQIGNAALDLTDRRSALEDTNLTEVIARVQAKLLSLEAAQASFARINRQSLFDLIS